MTWEELLAIAREEADEAEAERSRPPTACPQCGEPLQTNSAGTLHCSFDGWTYR